MHKPIYTSHEIGYDKDASINYFHDGTNNKFIDDKKYLVTSTKGKEITDDIDIELGYKDYEWTVEVYKLTNQEEKQIKTVGVWDCTFCLYDEEGNEVLNEDGSVKIFNAPKLDWSHIAEYVELDDLEEVTQ